MARITFNGTPIPTCGELPTPGFATPPFLLTGKNLEELSSVDLEGKRVLMDIFPSLDTPICAQSVRSFNELSADLADTVLLCISMDLPFAQAQFCAAEHLERVVMLSTFRHPEFGADFGLTIMAGPLRGLLARAVVALDENGVVLYTELVPELGEEPDYDTALDAIRNHHHPCPEDAVLSSE